MCRKKDKHNCGCPEKNHHHPEGEEHSHPHDECHSHAGEEHAHPHSKDK